MHDYNDENCGCGVCAARRKDDLHVYWDKKAKRMKLNKPQKFWMCWVSHKGSPMKRHPTQMDATTEAVRLARLPDNIGKKVYVLEATEYAQVDVNNLPVSLTGL